jgi:hypothetical protein
MYNAQYNGEDCIIIAEYNQDGIDYVTLLFHDFERNFVPKSEVIYE